MNSPELSAGVTAYAAPGELSVVLLDGGGLHGRPEPWVLHLDAAVPGTEHAATLSEAGHRRLVLTEALLKLALENVRHVLYPALNRAST